jgi:NitT/TauT family transport system ATP-binding protein
MNELSSTKEGSPRADAAADAARGAQDRPGAAIEVSGVSMSYSSASSGARRALSEVSFTLDGGKFLTLVGPSGCGKTTLLMAMAGLLTPTTGTVTIGGTAVSRPRPDLTGIVFQEANLLPWRTLLRNVALPLEVEGVGKRERLERAAGALSVVGLADFAGYYPREISGGMKQRVAMARALVTEPQVLLMDEPFSALDEQSRYQMGAELLRIWDRLNTTIVFITHSLSEAVFLSDDVIAMSGRPGSVRDRFEVAFDRPRDLTLMGSPEFAELRGRLYDTLEVRHG